MFSIETTSFDMIETKEVTKVVLRDKRIVSKDHKPD